MAEERVQRRLAAILAADVVGYSRMMRADEAGTLARLKTLRKELLNPKVDAYGGRIVKTTGDGTLLEFPSAVDAVQHAVDVQQAMARHNAGKPPDRRFELRIGINVGDVVVEGDDLYGDGVNIASRLEALAAPGGICISGSVYEQVRYKVDLAYEDMGEQSVKNIADPVRVYRVVADPGTSASTAAPSIDTAPRRPAVAVLPFQNLSGDPEQEYFADGLTEDIITALSLWKSFPVIARNSTFAYKGRSPDIRKVGEELGARYVIEGSVRRSGDKVRVTAQLINAETGHHVWAERYDRPIDDFFELQDEIADRIAAIIEPTLVMAEGKRIAAQRTSDLAAWDYTLRGFEQLGTFSREGNIQARALFDHALQLDPGYARAYCGIAYSHCRDVRLGVCEDVRRSGEAAMAAARRAVGLDDTDSQCHIMLARAYSVMGEGDAAIAEGRRALELNPRDTDALVMTGTLLSFWGESEQGIRLLESGLELNPLDPRNFNFMSHLCAAYLTIGEHDKAVRWGRESTRRNPDFFESHVNLAAALGHVGRGEEALRLLSKFDGSALDFVSRRPWVAQIVTDVLLDGLGKAGLSE